MCWLFVCNFLFSIFLENLHFFYLHSTNLLSAQQQQKKPLNKITFITLLEKYKKICLYHSHNHHDTQYERDENFLIFLSFLFWRFTVSQYLYQFMAKKLLIKRFLKDCKFPYLILRVAIFSVSSSPLQVF